MRLTFFLSVLVTAPLSAQASCPVASDLSRGVIFEMERGASWAIRAAGGRDRLVSFVWDPDYDVQTITYDRGAYLTGMALGEGDPGMDTVYASPISLAPDPQPGTRWQVGMLGEAGGPNVVRQVRYDWGAMQAVSYGNCVYDTVPMSLTHIDDEGAQDAGTYLYLPEFGSVVIVGDGFGTTWRVTGVVAQ